MSKLVAGIKGLFGKFVSDIRESPLETALCLSYFAIFLLRVRIGTLLEGAGFDADVNQLPLWFFPQLVLCYTLHKFKDRSKLLDCLYYLSWFIWIPLLLWSTKPVGWSVGICYLLAAIALFIGTGRMDNIAFGKNAISVAIKLCEGLLVGMIVWAIIYVLVASVEFLFDLTLNSNWYSYPSVFNWMVFTPLLCCSLLSSPADVDKGKKLLHILIDRVLSISLILYAVILYCYIIRILVRWELPSGGVAYIVLCFLCVALVCYLLRLQFDNRHYECFFKAFPAISVPALVLLWVATVRRIGEYGLTESRFFLLALSVLVTVFIAMLVKEKTRRFQLMTVMLAVSAIIFTFIPGISAKDFALRSQKARLEKLLPDVLENGVFPKITNYNELVADSLRCKNVKECYGAWSYLKSEMDSLSFANAYGAYGPFDLSTWEMIKAEMSSSQDKSETAGQNVEPQPVTWSLSEVVGDINLGDYTILVNDYSVTADSLGIAFRDKVHPEDTLIYCPVRQRLDAAGDDTPAEDVLVYENGRYKAIFCYIQDTPGEGNGFLPGSNKILLRKP